MAFDYLTGVLKTVAKALDTRLSNVEAGVPPADIPAIATQVAQKISSDQSLTTDAFAEGNNKYFTAARVLATVLAGIDVATSAAITASDTVLTALGKLQAQISSKFDKAGGTVTGNILPDGDVTRNLGSSSFRWAQLWGSTAVIGGPSQNGTFLKMSGLGAAQQVILWNRDGTDRWSDGVSSAGSRFWLRRDASGAIIDTPLSASLDTGAVSISALGASLAPVNGDTLSIGTAAARFLNVYTAAVRGLSDVLGSADTGRIIISGGLLPVSNGAGASSGGFVARGKDNTSNPAGAEIWTGGATRLSINTSGVMSVVPTIGANLLPDTDNTKTLGNVSARFASIWGYALNLSGDVTLNGGTGERQMNVVTTAYSFGLYGNNNGEFGLIDRTNSRFAWRYSAPAKTLSLDAVPLLPSYTVSTLPSASGFGRGLIYVSDGAASKRIAYSDAGSWRWVGNDAVVS